MGGSPSSEGGSRHRLIPGSFDTAELQGTVLMHDNIGYSAASTSSSADNQSKKAETVAPPQVAAMPAIANSSASVRPTSIRTPQDIKPGDIVIAVMGVTGSGKTTFVNHFADEALEVGHGLESCTQYVAVVPCTLEDGRKIWLVDTPGFDDTYQSDAKILREIANWLSSAYQNKIKMTGIVYLHRISDTRIGGAGIKNLKMFQRLCGEDGLGSVVLATTMWACIDESKGKEKEEQLSKDPKFWKNMIAHGSRMFRQDMDKQSATAIVNYLINRRRPVTLDIQKEMVDEKRELLDTGAGSVLATQVAKDARKLEKELEMIREELKAAIAQRDLETREELLEHKQAVEQRIARDKDEIRQLRINSDQLFQQIQETYERDRKHWTDMIAQKDKAIAEARLQVNEMKQTNEIDLEIEKIKAQTQLRKMQYASRCVVM